MTFKHKIVNDLAWVISSIPLMSLDPALNKYEVLSQQWFAEEFQRCLSFLQAQDSDPTFLNEFINVKGKQLLGKRFERFVEFWLRHSGRFEVVACNEPLRKDKITLGELDYIIQDTLSGELWHLEVAAKYYLGFNNSTSWIDWKGMNAKDSLKDKMAKFDKQLSLFERSEGIEFLDKHRINKPKPLLMLKGYFFYYWKALGRAKSPKFSFPSHNTGLFIKQSDISSFFSADNTWVVLSKHNWFAQYNMVSHEEVYSEITIQARLKWLLEKYRFGVMLARLTYQGGVLTENLRVAVVLDLWPAID